MQKKSIKSKKLLDVTNRFCIGCLCVQELFDAEYIDPETDIPCDLLLLYVLNKDLEFIKDCPCISCIVKPMCKAFCDKQYKVVSKYNNLL